MSEEEIDIVYLWCDDRDVAWRQKRARFAAEHGYVLGGETSGACRTRSNDDLQYSLRSVDRYAPFIRRIHIVIDEDAAPPSWLDLSDERIRIVRLDEFMPAEILPCFNSSAIEHFLFRIPGLSERFLYANDDFMFNRNVERDFFFSAKDGWPICRFAGKRYDGGDETRMPPYQRSVAKADGLVRAAFGLNGDFAKSFGHYPHHNIDCYVKSDMAACRRYFGDGVFRDALRPFRSDGNIERAIYCSYALAVGHAHYRLARDGVSLKRPWYKRLVRPGYADSLIFLAGRWQSDAERQLRRFNPALFCFNDNSKVTEDDRVWLREFYARRFPVPSQYERGADA